ncbi:hypothetical protein TWF718_004752 [Orbilia javanica]|uniref:F-box domain-containing protein n=1 Tax=Orbilia javanica TaxID=47235 RepID=A0AAN8RF90_9PEZI
MHRLFNIIELVEKILVIHASGDDESRKHVIYSCRRVSKSWDDLISRSPVIRNLTWQYTLYNPGGRIDEHTPFTSLERYISEKWRLLQMHINHIMQLGGDSQEPFHQESKRIVSMYFKPDTDPRQTTHIFQADSKIQFLQVTVYGYDEGSSVKLFKGKLQGKDNITIGEFDKIIHDALTVNGHDLRGLSTKICIQLSWKPPLPGIPNEKNPNIPPKPYSVRVIVVQIAGGRIYPI